LEVTDTGVGPSDSSPAAGKGFGTSQVRERLATLHGAQASFEFGPAPGGGSRAVIRLPIAS
jgi:signal transduction histidine kinase